MLTFICVLFSLALNAQERPSVAPIIQTQWGQHDPYDLKCPTINGQKAKTGCVATAMAQVMYHYQWPADAFAWKDMLLTYDASATDIQKNAVAELMADCGQSVNMEYGLSTSAAWEGDAALALVNTYGYAKSVREVFRNMYGETSWSNLIYHEIEQGRPVFYGGMPKGYTHQFLCDGYEDGKFHFNMAWPMVPDGYYRMNDLDRYPEGQTAIIGIQTACGEDVNTSFAEGSLVYTVVNAGEVSVRMNADCPPAGLLSIPAEVEHEGQHYTVTIIEYSAFEDSESLTQLVIPSSVICIGNRALLGCRQLNVVMVDSNNVWFESEDQVLKSRVKPELIAYPMAKTNSSYRVEEGVTAIPASLFRGNTYLESVEFPASLVSIDVLAFRGCTALTEVVVRNTNPKAIEDMAFDDDTYQIATLIVPAGTASLYRKLTGWKNFQHIKEMDMTSVTSISVSSQNGNDKRLYDLDGREKTSSSSSKIVIDGESGKKLFSR